MTLVELGRQLLVQIEPCRLVELELSLSVSGWLAGGPVTVSVELPASPPSPGGGQQEGRQPGEYQAGLHLWLESHLGLSGNVRPGL